MGNTRTVIIVKQGAELLGRFALSPGKQVLGRDAACDIRIQATAIADRHLQLTCTGGRVEVEDLGSPTGTFLAGKRLQQPTQLAENGMLHLGDVTVEMRAVPDNLDTLPSSHRPAEPPPVRLTKSRERVYEVADEVARGGMGAVLRATDLNIERTVAMKVVLEYRADDGHSVQRFMQEAKLTGQLEHPNIVPIYDLAFDEQGRAFYTMKFVKGVTLQAVLEKIKYGDAATAAQYSLAQLLTIFQKVCDAVAFAHSKGVIHRDLKPPNIMIGEYGEVLVMDWGLAKVVGAVERGSVAASEVPVPTLLSRSDALTMAGTVMGSPQFMAPEQANGKADEMDARTDIFALGGILYNILTLHTPVSGDSVAEMLAKIRQGEILPPSSYNSKSGWQKAGTIRVGAKTFPRPPLVRLRHCPDEKIPEGLAAVAMKALALKREDRYPTVPDLQQDITAYQSGFATSVEKAGPFRRFAFLVKRNKRASWATVLLTALFAVGFSIFLYSQTQKKRAQYDRFIQSARIYEQKNDWNSAIDQLTRANVIFDALEGRTKLVGLLLRGAREDIERKSWGAAAIKVERASTLDSENPQVKSLLPLVLGEGFLSVEAGFPGELIEFFYNEDYQPVIDSKTKQPRQENRGSLPIRMMKLSEGIHYFELRKEGKRFCSLPVEIVRGQPRAIQIPITEIPDGYEYIHEGEFIQGDDTTVQADGKVGRRKVFVPSFFMKRTPVTASEYRQFYASDSYEKILGQVLSEHGLTFNDLVAGAKKARDITNEHLGSEGQDTQPVYGVSYYEALAYAQWVGAKIPTSEQWEKAARGIDGRAFACGNLTPAVRHSDPSLLLLDDPTHEVTPFGCVGLTDTYWQWTSSRESPHSMRLIVKGGTGIGAALDRKPSRQKEMDPGLRYRTVEMIICKDLSSQPGQAKGTVR